MIGILKISFHQQENDYKIGIQKPLDKGENGSDIGLRADRQQIF